MIAIDSQPWPCPCPHPFQIRIFTNFTNHKIYTIHLTPRLPQSPALLCYSSSKNMVTIPCYSIGSNNHMLIHHHDDGGGGGDDDDDDDDIHALLQVSVKELEYAQNVIGEFGDDNRDGIVGTLHQISAIRSQAGDVIGLTYWIGRAVRGQIVMVRDLLDFGDSILFVGRPDVGKATVLREISRVLSDELHKRVVVVDASNEIGGGGDIPHPAIGGARRLQVSEPPLQYQVMIEAVENHMPEVLIVDEIGTESEVHACRTIPERGVVLIGSAHEEQMENIIKNPILHDLIGCLENITLSDQEARSRNCKKSTNQRKSPAAFPFLVEIRERNYWVVHLVRSRDEHLNVAIERWEVLD